MFTSLAAHAAQFAFLLWFENPRKLSRPLPRSELNLDIERIYGGAKKPLVSRVPLSFGDRSEVTSSAASVVGANTSIPEEPELATPGVTEGGSHFALPEENGVDFAGETETEPELPELPQIPNSNATVRTRSDSTFSATSFSTSPSDPSSMTKSKPRSFAKRAKSVSMHDLTHRFFRKPVIVLDRIDIFRSTDFALITLLVYSVSTLVPALPTGLALTAHFLHALAWRVFHSYGLGLLLRAQSKSKWLVRHYLKHYHYPGEVGDADDKDRESVVKRATEEAFGNWQVGYNISLVMTYGELTLSHFICWAHVSLVCQPRLEDVQPAVGLDCQRHHASSRSWLCKSPHVRALAELTARHSLRCTSGRRRPAMKSSATSAGYTLTFSSSSRSRANSPTPASTDSSTTQSAAWAERLSSVYGSSAIPSWSLPWPSSPTSATGGSCRLLSSTSRQPSPNRADTRPHMKSLYGDRLRKDGGLTKTLKSVAGKTFADQAGRHSDIKRVVQEVKGSIEKVEDKLTEAVGEFLDHARPMFSDAVNETKFLLQQTRERMIIT